MKIFISGSKNINNHLPDRILELIDSIIMEGTDIIIGDCLGIDKMVQKYLDSVGYRNVTVYVSGSKPAARNNIGNTSFLKFS